MVEYGARLLLVERFTAKTVVKLPHELVAQLVFLMARGFAVVAGRRGIPPLLLLLAHLQDDEMFAMLRLDVVEVRVLPRVSLHFLESIRRHMHLSVSDTIALSRSDRAILAVGTLLRLGEHAAHLRAGLGLVL